MALIIQSDEVVFVRHRKTGEVELRFAGDFSRTSKSPTALAPRHLHFTDETLSHACRCPNSRRHKRSSPVALSSTHLAEDVTRYLDEHFFDNCSMATFRDYRHQRHAQWVLEGVFVNTLHYATRKKNVVCRCTKHNSQGQGVVRNTEIQELCVQFFRGHPNKMTCTKEQWRMIVRLAEVEQNSKEDPFRHKEYIPAASLNPNPQHMAGIPSQVWETACPYVWNFQSDSESSNSTPLGSPIASRPPEVMFTEEEGEHITTDESQRHSTSTLWSTVQREAARGTIKFASADLKHVSTVGDAHSLPETVSGQVIQQKAQDQGRIPAKSLLHESDPSNMETILSILPSVGMGQRDSIVAGKPLETTQSLAVPLLLAELAAHNPLADLAHPTARAELFGTLHSPKTLSAAAFVKVKGAQLQSSQDVPVRPRTHTVPMDDRFSCEGSPNHG
ncbi:hypothetical protein DE146DRAFT_734960 [Phaeosphaeria sp. MPI-PUGE-AT-0046c]|nr:hypothetical protein DE146DRAFT_734960 [Phaeosphaeria sp. MPI-PUGE-AT-0046c]